MAVLKQALKETALGKQLPFFSCAGVVHRDESLKRVLFHDSVRKIFDLWG